jgi:hypothetical protein
MIKLNSTWIIDNLRIVIFGDGSIPFKEKETSSSLTGNNESISIKYDEKGESVIKEVTSLDDNFVFILTYFEKQNIIELSLNFTKEDKKISLDFLFKKIVFFAKKLYTNDFFKVRRLGVISDFHQDSFDDIKNTISTMSFLENYDDFDICLNKSSTFNNIKINQAININSSEKLFVKTEEPFNIPVTDMKKVTRLVIDVNTDIDNRNIGDYSTTLMKLVELSKDLIDNGGDV